MLPLIETALGSLFSGIVNKFFPNKTEIEKQQIAAEMQQAVIESDLLKAQLEINKAEASNDNLFVAGWRPFIGWCCGAAFAWQYVVAPIINCLAALAGVPVNLPHFDMDGLMPVLVGMLGLAGYRTYEKVKLSK